MKKVIIVAAIAALFGGAVFFGYNKHQAAQVVETTTPFIKEASIRTRNFTELITGNSNVTFREIFDKANDTIKKIDESLILLESTNSSSNPDAAAKGADYLRASQSLVRAMNSNVRARFELGNATDAFSEAVEELRGSDSYSFKYAKTRADKARECADKAVQSSKDAFKEARIAINNFKVSRAAVALYYPADSLMSDAVEQAIVKHFGPEKEEEKKL